MKEHKNVIQKLQQERQHILKMIGTTAPTYFEGTQREWDVKENARAEELQSAINALEGKRSAEYYLCKHYACSPEELQLNITLNPDKNRIIKAMTEFKEQIEELCPGCNVRHPFEHRCHGGPCDCDEPYCMSVQGKITHQELMSIIKGKPKT